MLIPHKRINARNILFIFSIIFFFLSFIILFFSGAPAKYLQDGFNNSDILLPFSVYKSILNKSHTDWQFGGYTPFLELLFGFILWLFTNNIQLTFFLYAVLQPTIIILCLLQLSRCITGTNRGPMSLTVIFATFPILIFSTGHLKFLYEIFTWYQHVSTICFMLLGLGWVIRYTTTIPSKHQLYSSDLIGICLVTIIAALSDALILAQFVLPITIMITAFLILKLIPFRRGVIAGLLVLYSTAAGLAMYQLPRLWGGDRIILAGSYMKPAFDRIIENWPFLIKTILITTESSEWFLSPIIIFYGLCASIFILFLWHLKKTNIGKVSLRYLMSLIFFLFQLGSILAAVLLANEAGDRYMLPIFLIPLFWGWPILILGSPIWLKEVRGKLAILIAFAILGFSVVMIVKNILANPLGNQPNLTEYYPGFIQCMDENAGRLDIHHGIAHYWQARPITLLSKTQLVVVQVFPDLTPMKFLNNSDFYRDNFDFVIIDNDPPPGIWIDRELVYQRFGAPATTFSCEDSDVLVYNRESDSNFRHQFISPISGN